MKTRTRTEYSILNILTGMGGYILNTILGFVCRMVFVNYLSADYLGVNGLFTNLLVMLSLAELGIGSAVVYALYKPLAENDEDKIASLVKFYGTAYKTIGIVVAIVGLSLLPFLNVIIREQPDIQESIYLLYFINLFNSASTYFFSYRSSLIIAAQRNYIVGAVNYAVTIIQSVFQMIALALTRNYLIYLIIQTMGTLIYNITISRIAVKMYPYISSKDIEPLSKEETKGLFNNIRDLLIYKISSLLVNSTDNILITFFDGLATTGLASNYSLLVNTLNSLLNQIFNGLTASVGNHNALSENDKKYEMFKFLNLMNFWIFGWAALGIIFCSSDIVQLCFGESYVLGINIPIILAINFYTVGLLNAVWTYKHTMGLFRYGRFLQVGTGILNIVLSILLGQKFGLFGILAATFVSRLLTSIWYDPYALFVYGFNKSPILYLKRYFYYLIVLSVAAGTCYFSFIMIKGTLIVRTIVKIVLCSIITNIVFCMAFLRTAEFARLKGFMKNILDIIKRKILKQC